MKELFGLFLLLSYPILGLASSIEISYGQTRNLVEVSEKILSFQSNRLPTIKLESKSCNQYTFKRLKNFLESLEDKNPLELAVKRFTSRGQSGSLPIEIKLEKDVYQIDAEEKLGLSYFRVEKKFEQAAHESILICDNKSELESFLKKSFAKRRKKK